MSTQRRENRWQRTSCMERAKASGVPGDRFCSQGWGIIGLQSPVPIARQGHAHATVGTAPPHAMGSLLTAWLATNSLQSDHRTIQFVRLVPRNICPNSRSAPPSERGNRATPGAPATQRSSLPFIPFPSGFELPYPVRPQFPVGSGRWTERYDGKRDLHFQHAA
jgi:hypothetical protein